MEGQVSFYNKSNGDKELVSLISDTLTQIRMYYTIKKEKSKSLEYKKGEEIDLINLMISSSDLWISQMIKKFEGLEYNEVKKITIDKNNFNVLKYLVDFYWHNMPSAKEKFSPSIYKAFTVHFPLLNGDNSNESKSFKQNEDQKETFNILRLVE